MRNDMFNEYDVVKLKKPLPEADLQAGVTGTILMMHDDHNFEIEFTDSEGKTLAVLTINDELIEVVNGH